MKNIRDSNWHLNFSFQLFLMNSYISVISITYLILEITLYLKILGGDSILFCLAVFIFCFSIEGFFVLLPSIHSYSWHTRILFDLGKIGLYSLDLDKTYDPCMLSWPINFISLPTVVGLGISFLSWAITISANHVYRG